MFITQKMFVIFVGHMFLVLAPLNFVLDLYITHRNVSTTITTNKQKKTLTITYIQIKFVLISTFTVVYDLETG